MDQTIDRSMPRTPRRRTRLRWLIPVNVWLLFGGSIARGHTPVWVEWVVLWAAVILAGFIVSAYWSNLHGLADDTREIRNLPLHQRLRSRDPAIWFMLGSLLVMLGWQTVRLLS